jgi:ABC-2 type transport system ATP-binding protein
LFLDEPTTGFDPVARREFWHVIEELRDAGTSMVLTTHYMEEAERLCDRLAIMAKGQIVAEGTSASLISGLGATTIRFEMPGEVNVSMISSVAGAAFHCRDNVASVSVGEELDAVLLRLLTWSQSTGTPLCGLEVVRPTLNDVFLGATKGDE